MCCAYTCVYTSVLVYLIQKVKSGGFQGSIDQVFGSCLAIHSTFIKQLICLRIRVCPGSLPGRVGTFCSEILSFRNPDPHPVGRAGGLSIREGLRPAGRYEWGSIAKCCELLRLCPRHRGLTLGTCGRTGLSTSSPGQLRGLQC